MDARGIITQKISASKNYISQNNRSLARKLFDEIDHFNGNFKHVSKRVLKDYGVKWSELFNAHKVTYFDPGHKFVSCAMVGSYAYYSNLTWALAVGVTNTTPETIVNYRKREYFTEFVSQNGSFNLRMQNCTKKYEVVNSWEDLVCVDFGQVRLDGQVSVEQISKKTLL